MSDVARAPRRSTSALDTGRIGERGSGPPRPRNGIAVLVSRFPKLTETFILREIDALERAGVPVTLVPLIRQTGEPIHPQAEPWMDRALWSGWLTPAIVRGCLRSLRRSPVAAARVVLRTLVGGLPSPGLTGRNFALLPKALYLADELRRRGVGHVHAHFATHPTTVAWIVSRVAGIDYSFTAHAHDIFVDTRLLDVKIREARFVRAISRHNAELLRRIAPEVPEDRVRVLRLGVSPPATVPTDGERAATAERAAVARSGAVGAGVARGATIRILTVAALRPYKGLEVLLDACAGLRAEGIDLECEIVGDGPLRRSLQARMERLGIADRAHLAGALTQEQVADRLAAADVFVHPGVVARDGRMDGIPVALMEAMSAGLPVVATDLSGIPELIADRHDGLLVPARDTDALATAIREIVERPDLRRRLGRNAIRKVREGFDLDTATEGLAAALDEVNPPPEPELAAILPGLLRDAGWPPPERLGMGRVRRTDDGVAVELTATVAGDVHHLVLKRHLERPGAERSATERARHELRTLSLLEERLASRPGLGVPSPLAGDGPVLLMTRCEGRSLETLLREGRWTRRRAMLERLHGAVFRAGKWLAAMHASLRRAGNPGAALETMARALLHDLEHAGTRRPDRVREAAGRLTMEAASGIDPTLPVDTLRHGDFWPGNVLVAADRLSVVDFEGARQGIGAYDVAYFLVHLEAYYRWAGLGRRGRRLGRRFLSGYSVALPLPLLRLSRMAVAARLLAAAARRANGSDDAGDPRLRRLLLEAEGWTP